ncbi:LacI family DNA-binding transcriptional regulator [Clostridium sediminicola]|uniref:LacI family DNA-binding transcriptional regulator n=1 Tax=Clostridium sediminicola TaxID=3114879 RepID=UPI0031F26E86
MKGLTINDIAEISGYSKKTVSRVINNEKNVRESTRKAILSVMKQYNYKPNVYAKNLNKKVSKNILISVRKSRAAMNEWINTLLFDLVVESKALGYNLIVEDFYVARDFENSLINTYSNFIDGVILFYEKDNDERIKLLNRYNIPFVVFGMSYTEGVTYVSNDNYESSKNAIKYILDKDMRKGKVLLGNRIPTNIERVNGALSAFKDRNIDDSNLRVVFGLISVNDVYEYVVDLISKSDLPEFFYVSGDDKALGVLKALNEYNIKIPSEVSVIGYDNIPSSKFYFPSLTTISPNYKELSKNVVYKLHQLINGEAVVESFQVKSELVIRDSTKK